jgi:pilus assembly protein CpaB
MTPARIAIVVFAFVAAIGLALVVRTMVAKPKPAPVVAAAAPAPPMTRVLVAKVDLNIGDRLSADNMSWQTWPASTLNAEYISDGQTIAPPQGQAATMINKAGATVGDIASGGGPKLQAMIGAIVRSPIYTGQPITSKEIIRSGDTSYMAVRLPSGMRAESLPVSVETAAGGFINPGDHVDLFSTHADTTKGGGGGLVTEQVLTNAVVLAVDQHTDQPKTGSSIIGATVTLQVPDGAAAAVARARNQGGLTLALRSYADIGGGAGHGVADHSIRIFKGGAAAEVVSAP